MKARLICCENDHGAASNVGGPVEVRYKSFEIELPPEAEAWLHKEGKHPYISRFVVGVEISEPTT